MSGDLNDIKINQTTIPKNVKPDDVDRLWVSALREQEIKTLIADRDLRKKYANRVWWFFVFYLIIVCIFLLISGFPIFGFKLHDAVLVTLAGSTAVAAIGLVGIIAKGLFNQPK